MGKLAFSHAVRCLPVWWWQWGLRWTLFSAPWSTIRSLPFLPLKNGLKWFYACAFWESRHNIWLIRWAPSTTGKWSEHGWWPHWVILRELYLRPWESFHLRDLPFGGHPDFLCPTAQRPPCGPLWPSFQDMGSVPGEIVVFFSLQGATSLCKDSFSQQAKMTWKSDSARVTNWTFSREKYYLIETSFYPAEKLYCAVGIVSY